MTQEPTPSNLNQITAHLHSDPSLEREVLGLIITSARDQGRAAMPTLERDLLAFPRDLMAVESHQMIWTAVRQMVEGGALPTPYELRGLLPEIHARVWADIFAADQAAQLAPNLERLRTLASARQVHAAASWAQAALKEGHDPEQVAQMLAEGIETGDVTVSRPRPAAELGSVTGYLQALTSGLIPMVSTGFTGLDEVIAGGLEAGTYVLLGMPTNVGKTRLALSIALHQLESSRGVTYLSGEMKSTAGGAAATHRLKLGLVLMKAGVSPRDVSRYAQISPATMKRIADAERWIDAAPLHIHDRDMSTDTIASIARRMRREGQTLMIIDNLNHVTLSGADARMAGWESKNLISERLADIAHSTGIIVLVLMQTKIDANIERPAKLDEISDSKGVSRPADLILTAWRPVEQAVRDAREGSPITQGQISVVKRRAGVGGVVNVWWNEQLAQWQDPEASLARTRPIEAQQRLVEGASA